MYLIWLPLHTAHYLASPELFAHAGLAEQLQNI